MPLLAGTHHKYVYVCLYMCVCFFKHEPAMLVNQTHKSFFICCYHVCYHVIMLSCHHVIMFCTQRLQSFTLAKRGGTETKFWRYPHTKEHVHGS